MSLTSSLAPRFSPGCTRHEPSIGAYRWEWEVPGTEAAYLRQLNVVHGDPPVTVPPTLGKPSKTQQRNPRPGLARALQLTRMDTSKAGVSTQQKIGPTSLSEACLDLKYSKITFHDACAARDFSRSGWYPPPGAPVLWRQRQSIVPETGMRDFRCASHSVSQHDAVFVDLLSVNEMKFKKTRRC